MNRLRFLFLATAFLIGPASTARSAPVPATRSGLEQVPDTAPLVLHVRGVEGVHDRLVALMKAALPDLLNKHQSEIDDFFKKGPDNVLMSRKIRGLAKDGPHFFALLELPKPNDSDEPKMAMILTVNNYKEFRDSILTEEERKNIQAEGNGIESATFGSSPKPTYFLDRKGYAVVTPDKEVAESFTKKFTGLHTKVNKELAAKLLASDLGLYVNMDAVNKEYGEQIKQAKQGIEQALAFGAAAAEESQKRFAEIAKKAIDPTFQTIEDMQALLLTFELRSGGLALNLQGEVKENSIAANYLQDARPISFDELGRLPRGRVFYLGMKSSAGMYKKLGNLIAGIGAEQTKNSADLMKELAKAGPNIQLSCGSFPPAGLDVDHYDDPAKAVAATLKMYRNMEPEANNLKKKPVVKADAETFGKFKLHSVQLTMDFAKMAEQAAVRGGEDAKQEFIEAMKKLLGEKKTIWFGTDGKTSVQITAPDWKTASKLLEQYSKNEGTARQAKAFHNAQKELPKKTSFLVLADPVHLAGRLIQAGKPAIPGLQVPPDWPNLSAKGSATYVGLALTLQPRRGSIDLFITAAAAQDFYKFIIQPLVGE